MAEFQEMYISPLDLRGGEWVTLLRLMVKGRRLYWVCECVTEIAL